MSDRAVFTLQASTFSFNNRPELLLPSAVSNSILKRCPWSLMEGNPSCSSGHLFYDASRRKKKKSHHSEVHVHLTVSSSVWITSPWSGCESHPQAAVCLSASAVI